MLAKASWSLNVLVEEIEEIEEIAMASSIPAVSESANSRVLCPGGHVMQTELVPVYLARLRH